MNKNFIFLIIFCFPILVFSQSTHQVEWKWKIFRSDRGCGLVLNGDTVVPYGRYAEIYTVDDEYFVLFKDHQEQYGYLNLETMEVRSAHYDFLGFYDFNLAKAGQQGKFGFIGRNGIPKIPLIYRDVTPFNEFGISQIKSDYYINFIDTTGRLLLPNKYTGLLRDGANNLYALTADGKWHFYFPGEDSVRKEAFDEVFETYNAKGVISFFNHGSALVKKDGQYALITIDLEPIVPFGRYDEIKLSTSEGFSIVSSEGKYGIVDSLGNEVLAVSNDSIELLRYSNRKNEIILYSVSNNGKFRLLNRYAQDILGVAFDSIYFQRYLNTLAFSGDKTYLLDGDLHILADEYSDYQIYSEFYRVRKGDLYGLINEKAEVVLPFIYEDFKILNYSPNSMNGLVKGDNKFGMIGRDGKIIIPMEYDQILTIENHNQLSGARYYHLVRKDGKWGALDRDNHILIPLEYNVISKEDIESEYAHYFKKNDKCGLITNQGIEFIPGTYDYLHYYSMNVILVQKDGDFGVINKYNESVLPTVFDQIIVDFMYIDSSSYVDMNILAFKDEHWSLYNNTGEILKAEISESELELTIVDWSKLKTRRYDMREVFD